MKKGEGGGRGTQKITSTSVSRLTEMRSHGQRGSGVSNRGILGGLREEAMVELGLEGCGEFL